MEEAMCESEIDRLKAIINKQCKCGARIHKTAFLSLLTTNTAKQMEKLEPQMVPIRKTFNDRVTFFRQLQELSDAVSPVDFEGALEGAIQECLADCDKNEQDLQARQARHRYLEQVQQDGQYIEDDGCVMCRDEIKRGIMLGCAHYFCEVGSSTMTLTITVKCDNFSAACWNGMPGRNIAQCVGPRLSAPQYNESTWDNLPFRLKMNTKSMTSVNASRAGLTSTTSYQKKTSRRFLRSNWGPTGSVQRSIFSFDTFSGCNKRTRISSQSSSQPGQMAFTVSFVMFS